VTFPKIYLETIMYVKSFFVKFDVTMKRRVRVRKEFMREMVGVESVIEYIDRQRLHCFDYFTHIYRKLPLITPPVIGPSYCKQKNTSGYKPPRI